MSHLVHTYSLSFQCLPIQNEFLTTLECVLEHGMQFQICIFKFRSIQKGPIIILTQGSCTTSPFVYTPPQVNHPLLLLWTFDWRFRLTVSWNMGIYVCERLIGFLTEINEVGKLHAFTLSMQQSLGQSVIPRSYHDNKLHGQHYQLKGTQAKKHHRPHPVE